MGYKKVMENDIIIKDFKDFKIKWDKKNMDNDIIIKDFRIYLKRCNIPQITIYNENTVDYKGKFVARLFDLKKSGLVVSNLIYLSTDLAELRNVIPHEMIFIPRTEDDDPNIIGSYI